MPRRKKTMKTRTQIWSNGGGVQSTAIAALIVKGKLPKPDLSVIIDTERELSTTWAYLDAYVIPALADVGMTLHRIRKSEYEKTDLYDNSKRILIPVYTTQSGDIGRTRTFCSNTWKKYPIQRWATQKHNVKSASVWIGFSTDELRRVKQSIGKWEYYYPLISLRMSRNDCYSIITEMGWPTPPRSSCWMCPNKSTNEWLWEKKNAPDDFLKAIQLEEAIREEDEDLYLTRFCRPLKTITDNELNDNQLDLFTGRCDSGMCFI